MFSSLQMPFLQALGYAITNSIWQVFLLWIIVLLVNSLIRQSSHIRYVTALSAQVAGFVWFLTTFEFYYRHCAAASAQAAQLADGNAAVYMNNLITDSHSLLSVLTRAEETLPYLSVSYLCFLVYLIAKWMQSFRFTKQLSMRGLEAIDSRWQALVNEMADRLNIMQDVKIYLSSVARSPLTIGYVKPVILLPIASINHLTTEQLEAVILHEMAHIKRSDYIINLMMSVAEMIMFFNPFTRLLGNTIQKERENCCDDWVIQYQYNPGMYAEALLRIACLQKEGFEMNAAARKKSELLQRVKRMVQPSEKKFSYRYQAMAMMVIAGLLFCIAWLQPNENDYRKTAAAIDKTKDRKIVIAPVIAQVDNPFFNGVSLFGSSLQDDVLESLDELSKTVTDSGITSVNKAHEALLKTVPQAVTTLSPGNWQKAMKDAFEKAAIASQDQNVDFSETETPKPLFDSAFILQTVQSALSNADRLNDMQAGLEEAKKELQNIKVNAAVSLGFSFSKDYLNGLCINALASLQNLNFKAMQDSLKAASERIRTTSQVQTRKSQERADKQAQQFAELQASRSKVLAAADRQYRTLTPQPPATPEPGGAVDVTAPETPDYNAYAPAENTQPATYSYSYNVPAVQYGNLPQDKTSKTIHISRQNTNGSYNIVIEIRQ